MEQKLDLRKTLQDLGIRSIFTTEADLSAMTGNKHTATYHLITLFMLA